MQWWCMYRSTDPQLSLLNAASGLSDGASERLKASWADGFRREVMPELLASERRFSVLYADGGRPNWSAARLLGVCLLQQVQNLSDQQALDALSFDRRWQYALEVTDDDAYLSRRSLVEFRRRLVQHDADGALLSDPTATRPRLSFRRLRFSDPTVVCARQSLDEEEAMN